MYFVFEISSPSNSTKYGRSSLRNFAPITKFSLEWYAVSSPPNNSASRVIRKAERLWVALMCLISASDAQRMAIVTLSTAQWVFRWPHLECELL